MKDKLIQRDEYFSPPALKTIERGSILRIREETHVDGTNRVMLSFKTPNILKTGVETREETEVEVLGDAETVTRLLGKLEAKPLVSVLKERVEYTLVYEKVSFTITLDRVDALGSFVEIELVSDKKDYVKHLIDLGEKLAEKLGIDLSKKVSLGYHELLLENKTKEDSQSRPEGDR